MQWRLRPSAAMPIWALAASALLAACFTTTSDFQRDAEEFIADQAAPQLDTTFQSVTCAPPPDQNIGTSFMCDALDSDGDVWEFEVVIDASNGFTVNIFRRPEKP